jgi:hypothetical protein
MLHGLSKESLPFYYTFFYNRAQENESEKCGNEFRRQVQSQEFYVTVDKLLNGVTKSIAFYPLNGIIHFLTNPRHLIPGCKQQIKFWDSEPFILYVL